MKDVHETRTPSGITIPDPDQGTPHVVLVTPPVGQIDVWEAFEDGTEGGHNLFGFLGRWEGFVQGDEPYLNVYDPRFGHPAAIPRSAIEKVSWIGLGYRRREDTRAGVRSSLAVPGGGMRRLPNGDIEIQVPRG